MSSLSNGQHNGVETSANHDGLDAPNGQNWFTLPNDPVLSSANGANAGEEKRRLDPSIIDLGFFVACYATL